MASLLERMQKMQREEGEARLDGEEVKTFLAEAARILAEDAQPTRGCGADKANGDSSSAAPAQPASSLESGTRPPGYLLRLVTYLHRLVALEEEARARLARTLRDAAASSQTSTARTQRLEMLAAAAEESRVRGRRVFELLCEDPEQIVAGVLFGLLGLDEARQLAALMRVDLSVVVLQRALPLQTLLRARPPDAQHAPPSDGPEKPLLFSTVVSEKLLRLVAALEQQASFPLRWDAALERTNGEGQGGDAASDLQTQTSAPSLLAAVALTERCSDFWPSAALLEATQRQLGNSCAPLRRWLGERAHFWRVLREAGSLAASAKKGSASGGAQWTFASVLDILVPEEGWSAEALAALPARLKVRTYVRSVCTAFAYCVSLHPTSAAGLPSGQSVFFGRKHLS